MRRWLLLVVLAAAVPGCSKGDESRSEPARGVSATPSVPVEDAGPLLKKVDMAFGEKVVPQGTVTRDAGSPPGDAG